MATLISGGVLIVEAHSLKSGLDANKDASPNVGDVYVATDTSKLYVCFVVGAWTNIVGGVTVGVYAGTTTLTAGNRSVTVAHGIGSEPTSVVVMPNKWIGNVWVDNINATNFTIHTSASVDEDVTFTWMAKK